MPEDLARVEERSEGEHEHEDFVTCELCECAAELQRQYNRFAQDFAYVWARELVEAATKKVPGRAA